MLFYHRKYAWTHIRQITVNSCVYADRTTRRIALQPDDKVLLPLADNTDKLAVAWQGLLRVIQKFSEVD